MTDKPTTLTGNDLALAAGACALAITWWKEAGRSNYSRQQQKALKALCIKLQRLDDAAYPNVTYSEDEGFNVDACGDEPIMKLDPDVLAQTTKLGTF